MRVSSRLLISPAMTIALTATVVAIAIILLTANIPITNAQQQQQQQQQQPLSSQPAVTQNGTTLFQSTDDGIRLKVPEGWVIHEDRKSVV